MKKFKVTHVEGITEFEGKTLSCGRILEFETDPGRSSEILSSWTSKILLIEWSPLWNGPGEEWTVDFMIGGRLNTIEHDFVAFHKSPLGGFYMIEKGE